MLWVFEAVCFKPAQEAAAIYQTHDKCVVPNKCLYLLVPSEVPKLFKPVLRHLHSIHL